MKISSLALPLLTLTFTEFAQAGVVPILRNSEVSVKGSAGDHAYNQSRSTRGTGAWSGAVNGSVAGAADAYSSGSTGQGSAFDFNGNDLSKVALEMACDVAQRAGLVSGDSRFDLKFKVTDSPIAFQLWGFSDYLADCNVDLELVNVSSQATVFAHPSKKTSDPLTYFEKLGVLQPGEYELRASSFITARDEQGMGTTLEATLQFEASPIAAVPLPAALVPGLFLLGAVVARRSRSI